MLTSKATPGCNPDAGSPEISPSARDPADALLDRIAVELQEGQPPEQPLARLATGLALAAGYMPEADWDAFRQRARRHPLFALLKQDPLLRRAADRPGGGLTDATLLDLAYGLGDAASRVARSSALGRMINAATSTSHAAEAIRERYRLAARAIDAVAATIDHPIVVTVGTGHVREVDASAAFVRGAVGRWIAVDCDADTLAASRERLGGLIDTLEVGVDDLLNGRAKFPRADFIQIAGFVSHLPDRAAVRLLSAAADRLHPGGQLLFDAISEGCWDGGLMQVVFDKPLHRRDGPAFAALSEAAADGGQVSVWRGVHDAIHYGRITRA